MPSDRGRQRENNKCENYFNDEQNRFLNLLHQKKRKIIKHTEMIIR